MAERRESQSGTKMSDRILLGFQTGTGEPVYLSVHHLAIFGMTQLSGKTTALEALISRSGLTAIAFKTKRGEGGFTKYNLVTPYYKPRADWQYVEALVNVALGEKVKYEPGMRYAIMKVCKGRKDLKEIQLEARRLAKTDKSAFMRSVYEKLDQYLDIVIPELEKWVFAEKLDLTEGVNVMDLTGMRLETQHLVISATIEYAFAKLDHTIVIIPEAWETIPQSKMTPVKWVAQQFIRKGAAIGNYLWLDSQDIGGIDKTPLRQCDNWLMGRMKEAHEVERILKQLLGLKVPKKEIQTLPLGHFYAAIGNEVIKVYVLPFSVPEEDGIKVARGELAPEYIRDTYLKSQVSEVNEDLVWKEKAEEEKRRREEAENKVEDLEKKLRNAEKFLELADDKLEPYQNLVDALREILSIEGTVQVVQVPPEGTEHTTLHLEAQDLSVSVKHSEKIVNLTTETQQGQIMYVVLNDLSREGFTEKEVSDALKERGWAIPHSSLAPHLSSNLVKLGLVIKLPNTRPTKYRLPTKVQVSVAPP